MASDVRNEGRKIVRIVGLLPFEGIAFSLVPEHPDDLGGIPGILEGGQSGSNGVTENRVTGAGSRCPVVIQSGATLGVFDDRIGHRRGCIGNLATKGDLHAKFSLGSHGDASAAWTEGGQTWAARIVKQHVILWKLQIDRTDRKPRVVSLPDRV